MNGARLPIRYAFLVLSALCLLPAACLEAAAAEDDEIAHAQKALFETPYLSELSTPDRLRYSFTRSATDGSSFDDRVTLELTKDLSEGRRNVAFEFLSGGQRMPFSPMTGVEWNPLVMLFLQRDVILMANRAGGSSHYFRSRILQAFRTSARTDTVEVEVDGRPVEMTRVRLEPYVGDPERARFAADEHKRYEFLVSPEVPGGIYRIRSLVPGKGGNGILVEESMTFEGKQP